ncbi:MAG: thiamine pyrophosphate-binding protein [Methanobacteriaceae archaeon]|nr:thiamine pyrophosphate-binding protein [Methanobacteriaceae archaeon]
MNKSSMMKPEKISCAKAITNILEQEDVEWIFGHPGEQILSLYDALRSSPMNHILVRHEQSAAHAADGYARASGKFGACVATAGPGALNLVMGVATAYRDSIPILVITGDVPTNQRGQNTFQDIDLCSVFKPISRKTFYSSDASEAILNLKKSIEMLKKGPTGPIHLNLPKNVLDGLVDENIIFKDLEIDFESKNSKNLQSDLSQLEKVVECIKTAKKPLIVAGAGLIWSDALNEIKKFVNKSHIPLATTYHGRGILREDDDYCVGLIGNRGTPVGNYAGANCDLVLGLGCRFSERTLTGIGSGENNPQIVQVNIDPETLKGDINLQMDVKEFLNEIMKISESIIPENNPHNASWLKELHIYSKDHPTSYDTEFFYSELPLKPQQAIKEILDAANDSTIVNDAGTHTTWVTLYKKVLRPFSLLFSGAFGPMGYGLPAAIGASFARPDESIVAIIGDGGFQMTLQELATVHQYNLPMVICLINNSSLGIIRQWQEMYHSGSYEVELENPDFVKLAKAYGIEAVRVESPGDVFKFVKKGIGMKKPFLIDISVKEENIPLPDFIKE